MEPPRSNEVQQVPFGLAYQLDEDFALAPALTAKAVHDLVQALVQLLRLGFQGRGGEGALLGNPFDEVKVFFGLCKGWRHQ